MPRYSHNFNENNCPPVVKKERRRHRQSMVKQEETVFEPPVLTRQNAVVLNEDMISNLIMQAKISGYNEAVIDNNDQQSKLEAEINQLFKLNKPEEYTKEVVVTEQEQDDYEKKLETIDEEYNKLEQEILNSPRKEPVHIPEVQLAIEEKLLTIPVTIEQLAKKINEEITEDEKKKIKNNIKTKKKKLKKPASSVNFIEKNKLAVNQKVLLKEKSHKKK